jgi:hypothetical protein
MTTFLLFLAALVMAEAIVNSTSLAGATRWLHVLVLLVIALACLLLAGVIGPVVIGT